MSELLRYMLYKCNEKTVPLSAEIDYINNYFALEKLRYTDEVRIEFNTQFTNNLHIDIAPLLFTPFLENAFKHGLNQREGFAYIDCMLSVENGLIRFSIENSMTNYSI